MTRPVVSDAAERMYAALRPYQDGDGEVNGWALLHLCEAAARTLAKPSDMLRHDDIGSGWRRTLNPARCPAWLLPWLAQWVGTPSSIVGLTEERQRAVIADAPGLRRGTLGALTAAARLHLTGAKTVQIIERAGGPYRIAVSTYTGQTPDPDQTRRDILSQLPAGLVLTYIVSDVPIIDAGTRSIDSTTATIDGAAWADVT
jgi:hypothetical protein